MGRRCFIKNCAKNYDKNIDISYHRFPIKNVMYLQWLQSIPENLLDLPLPEHAYICSIHFDHNLYQPVTPTLKNILRKDACPTIFNLKELNKDNLEEDNEDEIMDNMLKTNNISINMDIQVPAKSTSTDHILSETNDSCDYQMTIVKEEIQLIGSPLLLNDDTYQVTEQTGKESPDFSHKKIGLGRFDWPHEAVWALLDAYKQLKHLLKNKKKAKFWTIVASRMAKRGYNITAFRCKKKITKLKNTYENIKKRSAQSGINDKKWKYFDTMDELFKKEPYVIPVVTLDSSNPNLSFPEYNVDGNKSFDSYKIEPPIKRLKQIGGDNWKNTIEKIIAIMEKKAILRKKMHKESMARQDKLLKILERTEKLFAKQKSNECTRIHDETAVGQDELSNIQEEILGK